VTSREEIAALLKNYLYDREEAARAALDASLGSLLDALDASERDTERINYLEAHDFHAMCWNVSEWGSDAEHWAAPMKPNNGWTISDGVEDDDSDDSAGTTLRDAIDWSMKQAASRATPSEGTPNG
jgi:hypothetical protein